MWKFCLWSQLCLRDIVSVLLRRLTQSSTYILANNPHLTTSAVLREKYWCSLAPYAGLGHSFWYLQDQLNTTRLMTVRLIHQGLPSGGGRRTGYEARHSQYHSLYIHPPTLHPTSFTFPHSHTHQPENYEAQLVELHKAKAGYTPAQAESEFLQVTKDLPRYGMHLFAAQVSNWDDHK